MNPIIKYECSECHKTYEALVDATWCCDYTILGKYGGTIFANKSGGLYCVNSCNCIRPSKCFKPPAADLLILALDLLKNKYEVDSEDWDLKYLTTYIVLAEEVNIYLTKEGEFLFNCHCESYYHNVKCIRNPEFAIGLAECILKEEKNK